MSLLKRYLLLDIPIMIILAALIAIVCISIGVPKLPTVILGGVAGGIYGGFFTSDRWHKDE